MAPVEKSIEPRVQRGSVQVDAIAASASSVTFLPPLAPSSEMSGRFDVESSPEVVVCRLESAEDPASPCTATVARFTRSGMDKAARLRVDAGEGQYIANWRTPDAAGLYRIVVLAGAGGLERGGLVVRLTDAKSVAEEGAILRFAAGRTLPIKFRLAPLPAIATWRQLAPSPASGGLVSFVHAPEHDAIIASHGGDWAPMTLWWFDLATDRWAEIPTTNSPWGQVRRIVHDPVHHEILTFAEGPGPVYAVAEAGGTWRELAPQPWNSTYNAPAVFWHVAASRLAFFGGYGFMSWSDGLWAYDRAGATWGTLDQSAARPMPRFATYHGIDEAAGALYLAGGQGHPSGSQYAGLVIPSDLWRLDFATNAWTELLPDDASRPAGYASALDVVPTEQAVYRFGGVAAPVVTTNGSWYEARPDETTAHNRLERLDLRNLAAGWQAVVTEGSAPSPRRDAGLFFDAARHRLVVVGGYTPQGSVLDVYALTLP